MRNDREKEASKTWKIPGEKSEHVHVAQPHAWGWWNMGGLPSSAHRKTRRTDRAKAGP